MGIKFKISAGIVTVLGGIALLVFLILVNSKEVSPTIEAIPSDDQQIKLISVCVGEGTNMVECTLIPQDESLRTPIEKALAIKAEKE